MRHKCRNSRVIVSYYCTRDREQRDKGLSTHIISLSVFGQFFFWTFPIYLHMRNANWKCIISGVGFAILYQSFSWRRVIGSRCPSEKGENTPPPPKHNFRDGHQKGKALTSCVSLFSYLLSLHSVTDNDGLVATRWTAHPVNYKLSSEAKNLEKMYKITVSFVFGNKFYSILTDLWPVTINLSYHPSKSCVDCAYHVIIMNTIEIKYLEKDP